MASQSTYYGVQAYSRKGRGIVAEQPQIAPSETAARRLAERLAPSKVGVIAFKRSGDIDTGVFDDPVILAEHGKVPSADGF